MEIFATIKRITYLIFLIIVAPVYAYVSLPVLNIWFSSFTIGVIIVSACVAALEGVLLKRETSKLFKISLATSVLFGLFLGVMSLASLEMFRASAYRGLIGTVTEGEHFTKDIAPISLEDIRIIDQAVADRLGDKVLGEIPALGSQVEVGTFNIQKVGKSLYWVAPLLHTGFFKWLQNKTGTTGYIVVSATNERDVQLVTKYKGDAPVKIKYQPNAFLGDNLHRYLYLHGYATTGLTDFSFEIDDNGKPHWVVTLYQHGVGFSGDNAYGIVIVDAETGDLQEFTPENAPEWVDRIQPKEIVKAQLDYWGEYVNGYINLSNQDKLSTTNGISLVYGSDGRSYWYTGLTSVGRDQGTVGFVLVDTRTKKTIWYKQSGATEDAAQQSAMGKVQEKGYVASFPILYNINGVATYVMSLKDQAGLIKMIALVSVEDYAIVGVGNNLKEAVRAYKDAYNGAGKGADVRISSVQESNEHKGKISRIATDVSGGIAYYYLYLDNTPNKIFVGSSTTSYELPLTQVGDSVLVKYDDARTEVIDMTGFDNLGLQTKVTTTTKLE
jgi:hypothetical protein